MNEPQRLAVRAATGDGAAWTELVARFDLADLWDAEVYRLLPLVWRRFGEDVGAEHVERLKGVYRKAWVTNQHLRARGGEAVAALAAEGIDSLVLRGAALSVLVYEDPATRPMRNVDLLVRPGDAVAAWRLLEGLGYRARSAPVTVRSRWRREPGDDWYLRLGHRRSFDRQTLDVIDVHTTPTSDRWDRSVTIDLGGVPCATAPASDHLLDALLLGWAGTGEDVGLRRVVDALTVLERSTVDWSALMAAARRRHAALLVAQRLSDLRVQWGAEVPMMEVTADRRERLAARLQGRSDVTAAFVITTHDLGPVATVARAPRFLVDHCQVGHVGHLPLVAAQRLRQRLRR